jgi:PAS domain S-box-containing protein
MLCITGFDGAIKEVNPCWEWTLGFSMAQLRGRSLLEFMHEADRPATRDALKSLAHGGRVGGFENRCRCRDGSYKRFRWHATARPQEELIYAVACDLADARGAPEARQIPSPRRDCIIDAVAAPVFVKDRMHRFLLVNAAYCRFLGLSPDDLLGKTGAESAPPGALADGWAQDDRVWASGGTDVQVIEANDAAGRTRTLRVVKTVSTDQAGERSIVGTLADITEHREAEAGIRETARLKADLIALVNHEYANVLTSMKLALGMLKGAKSPVPDETRSHACEDLGRAIENLHIYTRNLVGLHRLESADSKLRVRPTPVRAVVLDALSVLRPLAETKRQRLSLETEFAGQPPVAVAADRDCLALIVNNLLANAVKYTLESGSITIRLALEGAAPAQMVLFSVTDTGIGIPTPELERMRGGFYRTQEGRQAAKGLGAGLKVVDELLAKHGSRLEIESEAGKGSRFSFRLPVWKQG